ncbi:MAG TPA: hypothetical protein VL240_01980 [Candidatus Binatia bacterium]|nr:hypothetical protein [Candidatus Binatia bacterium]
MAPADAFRSSRSHGRKKSRPSPAEARKRQESSGSGSPGSHRAATSTLPISAHSDPEQERDATPSSRARTGIVSVNGRDVGHMHCTGGRG